MYVVADTSTGQWLTEPIPYADAASIARLSGHGIEEVED